MAITNAARKIALSDTLDILGHSYTHQMSNGGYWYTYHPSNYDSNNVLAGNAVVPYQWDSALPLPALATEVPIDGTLTYIDDSWAGFDSHNAMHVHGGCIINIGAGVNDITNQVEHSAYFFAHIGTYEGGLVDDAFYWDRLYKDSAAGNWEFYQYHKHLPSNYNKFDDGRIVFDGDGFIRPEDRQFGYMINIRATSGGSSYSVPLARIHTPSVGGAHNSHNDVTLPSVAGLSYIPGGILKGSSNRFHAFYLLDEDSDGSGNNEIRLYSRTYTSSSAAFTPEVNYGVFPLSRPVHDPYPGGGSTAGGEASKYTFRASAGHTFGSKVYVPAIVQGSANALTFNFTVTNAGNNYVVSGTDRIQTHSSTTQPTIRVNAGDTINFNVNVANHPFYIKTNSQADTTGQVSNPTATGQGSTNGTVSWTPSTPGTYYYVCSIHNGMYGQIIVSSANENTHDLQVWSFTDANTISPGTLDRITIGSMTGMVEMPDAHMTSVGGIMYMLTSDVNNGGVKLFSTVDADSAGAWTDEGNLVSGDANYPIRVHGFKYNPTNTKFYALLSGTVGGSGTYAGKGVYSFDLAGGAFDGYEHLDWDSATSSLVIREPLAPGHLIYNHTTGIVERKNTSEPEGIASGTSILQYDVSSPQFFNKKEINTLNVEEFFQGIYLQDGRKALVGRVRQHEQNIGGINTGDLLLTIVDNENKSISYAFGNDGDDYVTGITEDVENNKLVLSGYCKGELAPKSKQWVHGWGRNIKKSNGYDTNHEFVDVTRDSCEFFAAGNDASADGNLWWAKYDKNYNLKYQKKINIAADSDEVKSINFNDGNLYMGGWTNNNGASKNALITKVDKEGAAVAWNKVLSSGGSNLEIVDQAVVDNAGVKYVVAFVNTYSSEIQKYRSGGVIVVVNEDGEITAQKSVLNNEYYFFRIKPYLPGTGKFICAGMKYGGGTGGSTQFDPALAVGDVNSTDIITNHYFGSGSAVQNENVPESYFSSVEYVGNRKVNPAGEAFIAVGAVKNKGPIISRISKNTGNNGWTQYYNRSIKTDLTQSGADPMFTKFTEVLVEDSDQKPWWFNEPEFLDKNRRLIITGEGENLDGEAGTLMNTDTFTMGWTDDSAPVRNWTNSMGHMGQDKQGKRMVWDEHARNFVMVGSSTSHSLGRDAILFRLDKEGWGTGVYHTDASTSNAYYYDSCRTLDSDLGNSFGSFSDADGPLVSTTALNIADKTASIIDTTYVDLQYNGSYGANGLFNGFIAVVDKDDLQSFVNSASYQQELLEGKRLFWAPEIFDIHQISTVGDATADDGNIFAYDIIKSDDGEYYYTCGQVSGNIARTNTGLSGVYDYYIAQFDIATQQYRFWQNGDDDDQEVYALTELKGTSKAVTDPEAENNGARAGVVSWTPNTAGTYYYQCGNHSAMNGQIVVQAAAGAPQTFNLEVVNQLFGAWRFTGTDRIGSLTPTADNPTITVNEGDTLNITVTNNIGVHPFWIQNTTGTGGAKKGNIAVCGRTTGMLSGDSNIGGYDLFLGIFDPRTWSAEYYNQGSGFNDKAMNIHDISETIPNSLALVYTTFGSVNGASTFGSEDIGVITFNYDSDIWSSGYQTGSETSEEIEQNGKPSTKLLDGRIGVVCNSSGAFADDANTFGLLDIGLGIFSFDSDGLGVGNYEGWKNYQVGSGSSDFSFSVDNNGATFLIAGYSEATFDKDLHGIFVEFDPEKNYLAKSANIG